MKEKQDRQAVRTAADIERKYNLGLIGKEIREIKEILKTLQDSISKLEKTNQ